MSSERIKNWPTAESGQKKKYPQAITNWDYQEVYLVHDALAMVNESINRLKLVPQRF